MASDNKVSLPGSFGGLMRFSEEYSSYINLKPAHVIVFVIAIIVIRVMLPLIF
jgi:preprotein translocase subunit Sec61beta